MVGSLLNVTFFDMDMCLKAGVMLKCCRKFYTGSHAQVKTTNSTMHSYPNNDLVVKVNS